VRCATAVRFQTDSTSASRSRIWYAHPASSMSTLPRIRFHFMRSGKGFRCQRSLKYASISRNARLAARA
jgi:hypothetical protein